MPKKKDNESETEEEQEGPSDPVESAWSVPLPKFNKGDMKHPLAEETRFEICFPKYREKYIKECWSVAQKVFDEHGIKAELDLLEGIMSVATTRKTWDPYIILKARDVIKLLGRSVPLEQAIKVLNDQTTCEIIKIKNLVQNRERLIKRRQRLIGTNGTALKTLELLTDCYVLVQGCTVAAIGPHRGVQEVVRVVLNTMRNIHPINLLKTLMIKRTLAKDPTKQNEDWSKYLPTYITSHVKRKKPLKAKKKKPYTPFPPERTERKVDEKMDSGRYFVEQREKEEEEEEGQGPANRKWIKKDLANKKKSKEKQKEKLKKQFDKPAEQPFKSHSVKPSGSAQQEGEDVVARLRKKLRVR